MLKVIYGAKKMKLKTMFKEGLELATNNHHYDIGCSVKDSAGQENIMDSIVSTKYWHQLEDGRVQCDVCPRACKLHEGQQGLCYVRACQNNEIVLTTYGRSSGFCVDPVEKKPLNHFLPGTGTLSFGTAGCNLACKFCQNWDISKSREMDTLADEASPEKIAAIAKSAGAKSVSFTYNDPVIFMEYAIDVAKACHALDLKTIAVSAGYICPEPRKEFFSHLDAANIDLKAFTDEFYFKQTGAHLTPVLETLEYIKNETDVWLEISTLLIPGLNDSDVELNDLSIWINNNLGSDVPLHFSAYHPDWKMHDIPATPVDTLIRARNIALNNGLHYVYTGNVHYENGDSSYCHHCGKKVIGRDWYELKEWNLDEKGNCKFCNTPLAGVLDAKPGTWGARRLPVQMKAHI